MHIVLRGFPAIILAIQGLSDPLVKTGVCCTNPGKELANFHFIECRITGQPTVEVNAQDNPRSATATFNAAAAGDFKYGGESGSFTKEGPIRRRIILHMRKEADGRWTVEDYDHQDITKSFMEKKVE